MVIATPAQDAVSGMNSGTGTGTAASRLPDYETEVAAAQAQAQEQSGMTGWGYCQKCTCWRDYTTGRCPVCDDQRGLYGHEEGKNLEMYNEFMPALLAVQDIDDEEVNEARKLAWFNNANVFKLRKKINVLRSIAMVHGRVVAGAKPLMPKGVVTLAGPDGKQWYVRWDSGVPVWLGPVPTPAQVPVAKPLAETVNDFEVPENQDAGSTVVRRRRSE